MKFAKHHKLLGNSNAENAEISAENTWEVLKLSLRFPLRSLRLCVEKKPSQIPLCPSPV